MGKDQNKSEKTTSEKLQEDVKRVTGRDEETVRSREDTVRRIRGY